VLVRRRRRSRRPVDELALPGTIGGLTAARIDNLDPLQRRKVSVVGREFLYRLVRTLSYEPDSLDSSLHLLSAADLIREKSVELGLEYVFKHALKRGSDAKGCFAATASNYTRKLPVETLAYHFQRSGKSSRSGRGICGAPVARPWSATPWWSVITIVARPARCSPGTNRTTGQSERAVFL